MMFAPRGYLPHCAALLLLAALAAGCDKKDAKPTAEPVASATSTATPSTPQTPASANAKTYGLVATGEVAIDMPAPKEHIKATAGNISGSLKIDPANLAATRGEVKVDLTTLKTATFGDATKDSRQTEHALTWLEVGPQASAEDQAKFKHIVFTILAVEGLSATEVAKVPATKDGADDVRVVTAKVKGEIFLHGRKSPREVDVRVTFRGPADKPSRVDIKTVKPLVVVLADHDVKPRDNVGKIAQGAFNLLGTKVATEAAISLDLSAKPN